MTVTESRRDHLESLYQDMSIKELRTLAAERTPNVKSRSKQAYAEALLAWHIAQEESQETTIPEPIEEPGAFDDICYKDGCAQEPIGFCSKCHRAGCQQHLTTIKNGYICDDCKPQPYEDLIPVLGITEVAQMRLQHNLIAFFQAVYDYCYTQVSDYLPQPHEYIYGSRNRPISAVWARIPEAHYVQLNHKGNEWIYTLVVVPEQLDRKTIDSYELELVRVPEAVLQAWNELLVTPSHTERVEQTTEPITLTPDGCLDTVLGEKVFMPQLHGMDERWPWSVVVISNAHRPLIWHRSTSEEIYQLASDEINKQATKAVVIFQGRYSNKPFLFYLKPKCHKCGITLTQHNQAAPYQVCNDCQMADLIEQMRAEISARLVQV